MTPIARRRSSPRGTSRGRTRGALDVVISREASVRAPARAAVTRVVEMVLRAERVGRANVSVTFVSNATIRRMNARFLRKDRLTDVIAFTLSGVGAGLVGDVYIAPGVARSAAAELNIPAREEILRLVIHGVLHVLGHDHPDGHARLNSAMWRRQETILRRALTGPAR